MPERQRRHLSWGRVARFAGSLLFIVTGLFYILAPPVTTTSFYEATWPPMVWGALMLTGGAVAIAGIHSRYMQIEQYGVELVAFGSTILALTQTFVMFDWPITWTRGGGTIILWAFSAWTVARSLELGADIRAALIAKRLTEG